jgi:hypothetical protein
MTIADIFFGLAVKYRPLMLDSQYHPRVVAEQAGEKSAVSQIDDGQDARAVANEIAEPHRLPANWRIGDRF